MKINFYALQRHTVTGETRELFLITQNWAEIHTWDKINIQQTDFIVHEIRNTKDNQVADVVLIEVPDYTNKTEDATR
jgi:hypothetical protein